MQGDEKQRTVKQIEAIAHRFQVLPHAVVTFQKNGESPERVRLAELLERLGKKETEQKNLF